MKKAVAKKPAAAGGSTASKSPARRSAAKPAAKSAAPKRSAAKPAASEAVAKTPRARPAAPLPAPPKARRSKKPSQPADIVERLRLEVARALEQLKAKDVVELDVRGRTSIADFIVVASGTSSRHVKSIADEVVKYAKQAGMVPLGVEGQREAEWVLVDLGDIIIHVMLPRVREFYGLERLWSVGGDAEAEAAYA